MRKLPWGAAPRALQRAPLIVGLRSPILRWSAVETRGALTSAAVLVIALAAWQAQHRELIRSPRLVLAHS